MLVVQSTLNSDIESFLFYIMTTFHLSCKEMMKIPFEVNPLVTNFQKRSIKWQTQLTVLPWTLRKGEELSEVIQRLHLKILHYLPFLLTDVIIFLNAVVLITRTIIISSTETPVSHDLKVTWDQIVLVACEFVYLSFCNLFVLCWKGGSFTCFALCFFLLFVS